MLMTRFVVGMFSVGMMILSAGVVSGETTSTGSGQAYPNKPIRLVTLGVGGGLDFLARLIAPGLTGSLGQPVIVENRGGNLSTETVSKAAPDGYTLLVAGGPFATVPLLQKTSYDPVRDFSPIILLSIAPSVLVVTSSVPVNSVKELIAYAKARPGELNYSTSSIGSGGTLGMELFNAMAGVNVVRILYKSGAEEMADLIAGRVQLTVSALLTVAPHVKSGRLKALAVTSTEPSALVPGVPTVASVLPGFEITNIMGILAPANTPMAIINRLNHEIVQVVNRPDVKQKLLDFGVEAVGSSPQQYAAALKSQMNRLGKVIKDAGIRVD